MDNAKLLNLVSAYNQQPGAGTPMARAQAERLLRLARLALAKTFLDATPDRAQQSMAGDAGGNLRLLLAAHLAELVPDAAEAVLCQRIRAGWTGSDAPPVNVLLAAMLMLRPDELPALVSLTSVPGWLQPDYARYLLIAPMLFRAPGDADRFHDRFVAAVHQIHDGVIKASDPATGAALAEAFLSNASFVPLYFNDRNLRGPYRERAEIFEAWALACKLAPAYLPPARGLGAAATRPIRIGLLAAHFLPQTETYLTLALFEHLPRDRCTITLYAEAETNSALESYCRGRADGFVVLPAGGVAVQAERLRADDLDLLLIASNVSAVTSSLSLLATHRLAWLQLVSGASPVSPGFTAGDVYLSASLNEDYPDPAAQYTEHLYQMPGMLNYYAYEHDTAPATVTIDRAGLGLPEDAVVYFSGANFFKILPELSRVWARILAAVPNSYLVLMPFNPNWSNAYPEEAFRARLAAELDEAGIASDRLKILSPVPARADVHRVMALADVYLDSQPFAGACSLLDPLVAGLPLVATVRSTFRGAVGAVMVKALGLDDMITDNDQAYLDRAVRLGRDPDLRAAERVRLNAAMGPRNPFYDTTDSGPRFAGAFADLFDRRVKAELALVALGPDRLRTHIAALAERLAPANPYFARLIDLELVRLLLVPYFRSLGDDGRRHLIDVGACLGQMAAPFLRLGWSADLFEPDPSCAERLAELQRQHPEQLRLIGSVVSDRDGAHINFHRSAVGLSGIDPSPYGDTAEVLLVPTVRLDAFARRQELARVDMLKVDAEGWDFTALLSHDFAGLPPRLAMVEFGTVFPAQTQERIVEAIAAMAAHGYGALVFSYEDDGNFEQQRWDYRLIAARFGEPVANRAGHANGNIIFYRQDDAVFLATVLRLFESFLPANERPTPVLA